MRINSLPRSTSGRCRGEWADPDATLSLVGLCLPFLSKVFLYWVNSCLPIPQHNTKRLGGQILFKLVVSGFGFCLGRFS